MTAVFVQRLQLGGDGLRVGVKDSIDIAGYPTHCGSAALADAPAATRHAAVVQSLLDAECRIIGKTNLHELAYGVTGINHWSGTPLNPRYPDRIPGGSSSGSAVAVATGEADFTIGTDTGGSIRIPATCCGVLGLKPSYGRVSRDGVHPSRSTLDCVGPFARDLPMLEHAMTLIDPTYVMAPTPVKVRVGLLDVAAEPAISAAVRRALSVAGCDVTLVQLPLFDAAFAAGVTIIAAEYWIAYGHLVESPGLGPDIRTRLLTGHNVASAALAAAEACRGGFQTQLDTVLANVDAVALPTMAEFPLPLQAATDPRATLRSTSFVRPFNLSGHPALSLPLHTTVQLPASLQMVGRRGADAALCAIGRQVEQSSGFSRDRT